MSKYMDIRPTLSLQVYSTDRNRNFPSAFLMYSFIYYFTYLVAALSMCRASNRCPNTSPPFGKIRPCRDTGNHMTACLDCKQKIDQGIL